MTNKNPTIDIARGIAIILVVYGHVIEHSMAPFSQDFFQNPVFKIIYTFHMPLFMFISGYLMACSLNRNSVQDVFKARCKSLLVPFVSLALLGILVVHVLNSVFGNNASSIDIVRDLADQLLLKPQVWFLFTLFVLSCLLLGVLKLEKRWAGIVFAGIYLLLMNIPGNNYCDLYFIKWFYPFYLAGYLLNKWNIKILNTVVQLPILLLSLVIFSWLVSYWTINDYIYINKMSTVSIYRYIMGFLGIMISFCIAGYLSKTKMASLLGVIGAYSLDIYIIQLFLLEGIYPRVIYKTNIHLDFNSPWVLYIVAPLMAMCFVGVCLLSSKLLIRKSRLFNNLLLGARA